MEYYICKLKSGCIGLNILSSDQEIFLGLQPRTSLGPREISWASGIPSGLGKFLGRQGCTLYNPIHPSSRQFTDTILGNYEDFCFGGGWWVGGAKNIFRIIVTIISLLDSLFPSQTVIFIESQGWPPSSCLLEVENHQLPKNLKSFRFLKSPTSC